METRTARFLVGVGGWEHGAFDECFYPPPALSSAEKLGVLAEYLDTVEVRQTFWDDELTARDAKEWSAGVAGNRQFLFTVKLHASFTHGKTIRPAATRNIRGLLAELARQNRLGALLAQFPYAFTNVGTHRYHLAKLGELFRGFPVVVELRHESWHAASTADLLQESGLRQVNVDLPRIRQFIPFTTGATGGQAYLRLHGRNEKGWLLNGYDARYDYLYNGRELQEVRRRCESLGQRCESVTVIFNNTTGGKAIANALQLRAALSESKRISVPAAALRAFPHLADVAREETAAASLFGAGALRAAM
jgi:uncharacterized protein YecE (DUF72 family)